jgi:RHS repeat-associated protein
MNDYIGNVVGLIDPDNGSTVAAYEYDPFGRELRATGSYAEENPMRFSSQYWDEETSLVYFGFRYYLPQWGRFLNRDPIEELGGINLYRFVSNDPVNRWDLLGLSQFKGFGPMGPMVPYGVSVPLPNAGDGMKDSIAAGISHITMEGKPHNQALLNASTVGVADAALTAISIPGEIADVALEKASESLGQEPSAVKSIVETAKTVLSFVKPKKILGALKRTKQTPQARGRESETRVLDDIGEKKNTEVLETSVGNTIPDFQNDKVVGEIKDTKTVSNTKQIRAQKEAASNTGRTHVTVTGTNTNVSGNAAEGSTVIRRDDLGPPSD